MRALLLAAHGVPPRTVIEHVCTRHNQEYLDLVIQYTTSKAGTTGELKEEVLRRYRG
jgi:hypothetical protein